MRSVSGARRAAGQQPDGLRAGAQEGGLAVRDGAALGLRLLHQGRGGPVQDEVEHEPVGRQEVGGDRRLALLDADAACVDQQLGSRQLRLDDRVVPRSCAKLQVSRGPGEVGHQRLGPVQVSVQHGDVLEAGADEDGHDRPRAAAGTEHDRVARPLALDSRQDRGEAGPDAVGIGVVAAQAPVDADEDVDGPAEPGVVGERIGERGSLLLVRRRDERAGEGVVVADLAQRIGQLVRSALPALDLERRPGLGQRCPKHALEGRLGQRGADDRQAGWGHLGTLSDLGMVGRGRWIVQGRVHATSAAGEFRPIGGIIGDNA